MSRSRRHFLRLAAGGATLASLPRGARALDYPARAVHIVVGYPPGIAPDIIGRLMGNWLSERMGQQFVVDNRPGAASNIGTEVVAKANPDGYTLLVAVSTNAINATLYANLSFSFLRDLVPVAGIGGTPFVVTAHPAFPPKSIPELIDYAKANPGKINIASSGVGTGPHVSFELFKMMTGVDIVHIPYRTSYMPDLLGGQISLAFSPMAQVIPFIRDGRLRAIAVTPANRSDGLPGVPAIAETLPGYAASGWYGICAPRGTPDEVIEKLHATITAGVADPALRARLVDLGIEPRPMTPAEFGQFIAAETEKWAKVIRFAALRPS